MSQGLAGDKIRLPATDPARAHPAGLIYDNLLSGVTFHDLNTNCVRDTNEPIVPNVLLSLGGDTSMVFSSWWNGNEVTYDYWHSGPHLGLEVGWDYELAKKLVQQGKGVEKQPVENEPKKMTRSSVSKPAWWQFWNK